MGYDTSFSGQFRVSPPLTREHQAFLERLARDELTLEEHGNFAPPGGYCQWVSDDNGSSIVWDGGEKFYDYIEWITFIAEELFAMWNYSLNGTVYWRGERRGDEGKIVADNNRIQVFSSKDEQKAESEKVAELLAAAREALSDIKERSPVRKRLVAAVQAFN